MGFDEDKLQSISAIYKFVYQNQGVHRNILRKYLVNSKGLAKSKFSPLLESLIALGKLTLNGENVSLSSSILQQGILRKDEKGTYIEIPHSGRKVKVNKGASSGYNSGEVIDFILEQAGTEQRAFVLGVSEKTFDDVKQPVRQTSYDVNAHRMNTILTQKQSNTTETGNEILGRVVKISHDNLVFIPNNRNFHVRQIPILNNKDQFSAFQDKICVMRIVDKSDMELGGYIVSVKGDAGNPIHEYDAIAETHGAIMDWTGAELENEISQIPSSVDTDSLNLISEEQAALFQKGNVVDLRHLDFTTVDPASCKDMDDAIYSTIDENGNLVCYTAVANVTKYVKLDSKIGENYINGGFTIYSPNKAYNILPTQLSTGICSLNPNEDRLAFVVKTVINVNTGKVKSSKIYDAIIQSKQKYSYEQAQDIVEKLKGDVSREDLIQKISAGEELSLDEQILMNYYAAKIIKQGFRDRRMIRFANDEERAIIFDSDMQDIIDIKPIPHLFYHEVIESFMVTANEQTAKYANERGLNNIYRIHDEPNSRKNGTANEFFQVMGLKFNGDLSAQKTIDLLKSIRGTEYEAIVSNFLVRMQSRAVYSGELKYNEGKNNERAIEPISHYALQSPSYSHTTSPIRRVPDFVTQFNILANMHGKRPIPRNIVDKIVEIANEREQEVDSAEREFEDITNVIYCEKHIGEKLLGRISKFKLNSDEEQYNDNIIVIVKDEEKGISVEIPLSEILGPERAKHCTLSDHHCAVCDSSGRILLTLCKPLSFIIEKADRKTMTVSGRSSKILVNGTEGMGQARYYHSQRQNGYINKNRMQKRYKRYNGKSKGHNKNHNKNQPKYPNDYEKY